MEHEGNINPNAQRSDYSMLIISLLALVTSIRASFPISSPKECVKHSRKTSGKIIYVCNAMTKRGETTNMEVIDFVNTIEKFINPGELDYVIVNNGHIDEEVVLKYKAEENKKPLKIKDHSLFENKWYKVIEWDMVNDDDFVRHDPIKLAKVLEDIVNWWIK
jgi:uncharacterized cofD-like protein